MTTSAAQPSTIEALSKRLRIPLQRFFRKRLKNAYHEEIEDLVQDVFLHLADGKRLESASEPDAYLFATARNLLEDYRRRLEARNFDAHDLYEEALHDNAAQTVSLEREILGSEAIERLVAALYGLPERTRNVWILYHFEDLAHSDISRRLGIAQSTIEKHMARANAQLLTAIEQFL